MPTSDKQQTVLLCLVGTTPAVLTETVFAMTQESEPIIPDRVVAVTTGLGRELLKRQLFDGGQWEDLKKTLSRMGVNHEGKLLFGPVGDSIRVFPDAKRERELDDIRTLEDNQVVAEFLMEIVRSFTENDSIRLVTSLAGGRKTTSALFHSVMTLLGRSQDLITHILVNDPWSTIPSFLFPGCKGDFRDPQTGKKLRSSDAKLQLAEVPFVPLRYLFKRDLQRSAGSYMQLIQQLRLRTINMEDELTVNVDPANCEVTINERVVKFSPNEFLFYLLFARRAADGEPPVESFSCIEVELVTLRDEFLKTDDFGHWASRALQGRLDPSEDPRKWAASIRTQLKKAGFDAVQIERLVPRRGHLAIEIPPEHIDIS